MSHGEAWLLPLNPAPVDIRLLAAILDSVGEKTSADANKQYAVARNIERSIAYLCCAVESGFISEVDTTLTSEGYSVRLYLDNKISDTSQ